MRPKLLQDPGLSEFVYTVAMTSPVSLRRHLPHQLFMATKTPKMAQRFAVTSSMEQKREYLALMGFRTLSVVCNVQNIWAEEFKEVIKKFEIKRGDFEAFSDSGLYIVADKRIAALLEALASYSSTKAYTMGLELIRAKHAEKGWPIKIKNSSLEAVYEKEEQFNSLVELASTVNIAMDSIRLLNENVTPKAAKILIFLYTKKNSYVAQKFLYEKLKMGLSKKEIIEAVGVLEKNLLIQRHFDERRSEFAITAKGISLIGEFVNFTAKLIDFKD